MKLSTIKPLFSSLLITMLLSTGGTAYAGEPLTLKQTMKEMRLQYKEALETSSAESFNQRIETFKTHLSSAQTYDFSPERKVISLEGLKKVENFITDMPVATAENLSELQHQLQSVDQLRKEYHKKAKPSKWELFLSIFQ